MRIIRYITILFAILCAIHMHASGYMGAHVSETAHLDINFTALSNANVDILCGIATKIEVLVYEMLYDTNMDKMQ